MYSKELEELIEVTLADGVVTDKERSVILKRAESEGIDTDEMNVYLDGKISSLNNKRMHFSSADTGEHTQTEDRININVNNKTTINWNILGWIISIIIIVGLTYYLNQVLYKTSFGDYSFILGIVVGVLLYRKIVKNV